MLNPIFIDAISLSDAFFQTIFKCIEQGRKFKIDDGSFKGQVRLEFDFVTIRIKQPWTNPLLPKINPALNIPDPVSPDYLDGYLPYLMTDEIKENESYTYGSRLCAVDISDILKIWDREKEIYRQDDNIYSSLYDQTKHMMHQKDGLPLMNQIETMIWLYKNRGHRTNQMILQIGQPSDLLLKDPACLRQIDTRIQDGKLHFFPYFRSWDLFNGFPANLAAIELLKQYCAMQIGVDNGEIIATSKGLHLYDYVFDLVEIIRGKKIKDQTTFKNEMVNYD